MSNGIAPDPEGRIAELERQLHDQRNEWGVRLLELQDGSRTERQALRELYQDLESSLMQALRRLEEHILQHPQAADSTCRRIAINGGGKTLAVSIAPVTVDGCVVRAAQHVVLRPGESVTVELH